MAETAAAGHRVAEHIAAAMRAKRAEVGMSRKELAARAGVSQRYLNELENGVANASIGVLVKVAEALQVELVELMTTVPDAARAQTASRQRLQHLITSMTAAEAEGAHGLVEPWLAARRRCTKGVALLGLRGAGKTTLGRMLAVRLGVRFVSLTGEIEQRAGMSTADLFNLGGEETYRSLENEVVAELAASAERIVLETAGGIAGNPPALDGILEAFCSVWLKAAPEEHLARVAAQGDTRPMRGIPRALEQIRTLLSERQPAYGRATFVLDTSGRSVGACVEELERIVLVDWEPKEPAPVA